MFIEEGSEGGHWKANKTKRGEGVLAYMYVSAFYKKYWDFQNDVL